MHPWIFREFDRICRERSAGGAVLEVGATTSDTTLLCLESLKATEKIGLNLSGPHRYRDFEIVRGNANCMDLFEDGRFDTVLCNATIEHDKFFWKSIREMRRVTKAGGLLVLGSPGFVRHPLERLKLILRSRLPLVKRLDTAPLIGTLQTSTFTYEVHKGPGDYYRFSQQAFEEVFFEGMHNVEIVSVLTPPRLIGAGVKP